VPERLTRYFNVSGVKGIYLQVGRERLVRCQTRLYDFGVTFLAETSGGAKSKRRPRTAAAHLPIAAAAAEIATSSAVTCGKPAEMFSYHRAKLAECVEPHVPHKSMDGCWRNAATARNRGSTFKRRYVRSFQNLPCDAFETDGKYQAPAGDQALQFLQCCGRRRLPIL